jgi:CMP-N-acetylneuraminic acid synthetase
MTIIDKPLCIIPSRGGSKRFPRKNIALLAGKPLLAYAVEAAVMSNIFGHVCVSSDDDEILGLARKYGATLALKRPKELSTDTAQVKDVCAYLLEDLAAQGQIYPEFAVLLVTNPFRTADDIIAAYDIFRRENAHSVISLVAYSHPPQRAVWAPKGFVEPYFGLDYMKQTQLLDPLYRHDGSIIFARSEVFLKEREFYGTKVVPFFIPPERSVDIDRPLDLAWAEFLFKRAGSLG